MRLLFILLLPGVFQTPSPRAQEPADLAPHATRPLRRYDASGEPSVWIAEEGRPPRAWWALQVPWLQLDPWDRETDRRARAAWMAQQNGWDRTSLERFLATTRPQGRSLRWRIEEGGRWVAGGEEILLPAEPRLAGGRVEHRVVLRLAAELASGSALADPLEGRLWSGLSLGFRLLPLAGRGHALDLCLTRSERLPGEPLPAESRDLAGLDRLPVRLLEAGLRLWMPPGEEQKVTLPGLGGEPWILYLELEGGPPPGPAESGAAVLLDLAALAAEEEWPALLRAWERDGPVWSSSSGLVALSGPEAGARAESVLEDAWHILRPWSCRIEGAGEAPELRLAARLCGRAPLRLASGEARRWLVDWDAQVAGTTRMLQPGLEEILEGWSGSLRWERGSAGRPGVWRLDLRRRLVLGTSRSRLRLGGELRLQSGGGELLLLPEEVVEVEHPAVAEQVFRGSWPGGEDGSLVLERGLPGRERAWLRLQTNLAPSAGAGSGAER